MSISQILGLSLSFLMMGCMYLKERKLTTSGVQSRVEVSSFQEKYIQNTPSVVDTFKSFERNKFQLKLKNSSSKDIRLVRISQDPGTLYFEAQPGALPFTVPQNRELILLIKLIFANAMSDGIGWYEGTAHFLFSDSTVETVSLKIYRQWPPFQIDKGIARHYKDPFPLTFEKNRIFIEEREIKAEIKFLSHYFIPIRYFNQTNDSLKISSIDYNKDLVSLQEPIPSVIPPHTFGGIFANIELGDFKEFDEEIRINFRDRPAEAIRIKLSIAYLDDQILTRLDTQCIAPIFGNKHNEYQSEIAFDQYVRDHIDQNYFEAQGIYGSGSTFVFNFMINPAGQITNINCERNEFPEIEKYLKGILIKSPKWKLPHCKQENNQKKGAEPTFHPKYRYRVHFPKFIEPTTIW